MKVLEINDLGKSNFIVGNDKVSPEDLSRENLLKLMNDIYEKHENEEDVEIPDNTELVRIENPVEQEIVEQIIQKISEFNDNVENIRQEISTQFPEIKK